MNQKAKEIGCQNTHFVNANGAHDENHYSTAYDMAQIASYCMKNETFKKISSKMECSLPTTDKWQEERCFKNTNSLMNPENRYYYPYCTGLKTGFTTPAKNCLIATSDKDGFELISVILHAESTDEGLSARYLDTISLFNYGYSQFALEDIREEYDLIGYVDTEETNLNVNNFSQNEEISNVNLEEEEQIEQQKENEKVNYKESFGNKYLLLAFCGFLIFYRMKKKAKRSSRNKNIYSQMYRFKYDI